MTDQHKPDEPDADAELQRELRKERKFSLNEALGQAAGQGMMKGGSPVSPQQQAAFEIEFYLREHVSDASGVLPIVLLRRVRNSALLLEDPSKPLKVLSAYLTRLLQSPDLIEEFVRETDVEWGRRLGEKPLLEKPGQSPHPDDPYTVESVRAVLEGLRDQLLQ